MFYIISIPLSHVNWTKYGHQIGISILLNMPFPQKLVLASGVIFRENAVFEDITFYVHNITHMHIIQ